MKIAIITLTENGRKISQNISENLKGCVRYAFEKHCGEEIPFSNLGKLTAEIFNKYNALIFICACGTAVRVIAPCIISKLTDPAVIVIDEQGKYAVSLLSGHVGGANALTQKIAKIIDAVSVITTATDVGGRFSPDSFAAANNLYICEINTAKEIAAAVVNGDKIGFYSDYNCMNVPPDFEKTSEIGICISDDKTKRPFKKTLHIIPKNIVVGVGCKKNTSSEKFTEFILRCLKSNGVALERVRAVNTIDIKNNEACIIDFGKETNISVNFYSTEQLMNVSGIFSHSDFVMKITGADNICERCAAVSGGKIIIPKRSECGMTFAAAELLADIDFERKIL